MTDLDKVFALGREINSPSTNPYLNTAYKYKLKNYRLISSGELLVNGKDIDIPHYIKIFLQFYQEVLMIANIISGTVTNLTFRSISLKKEFNKWGTTKSLFYGLGDLDKNFRYGDMIVLVEGHLDRDMMKTLYPNVLGVMTSTLSKNQVELLSYLTNKVVLMLDNDEAGKYGMRKAKSQLKDFEVHVLEHYGKLKDAGDLAKLEIYDPNNDLDYIKTIYKSKLDMWR